MAIISKLNPNILISTFLYRFPKKIEYKLKTLKFYLITFNF